nr:ribonuclease H-like domain-containing protein [Tanacetum cinerariifolium]
MESCDPVGTPMEIKDKLDLDQNGTLVDATKYRSMIGALMYLTSSRPDIVHATCLCARYQAKPTEKYLKEVRRIFRYLRGTVNTSLWYTKDSGFELTDFLDADYAGCKDSFKSTSGGYQFLVRCMLNVAIFNHWDLFQLDINNAFLYGDLFEDFYMSHPPGFNNQKGKGFTFSKSLYGLKQAPRQWNVKSTLSLIKNGFVQSKYNYSLFTKRSDNVFVALLVYVDDIVITKNNLFEIKKFKVYLKSKFQIKDLGKLKYFLSIEVLDNTDGICLSQRKYFLELLYEYGLLAAKHVDTPLPENTTLNHIE